MQNKITKSQISWVRLHIFENRSNHIFSFFEPVVLMYINPINSKKCGTTFSWIFCFWFIDFSKKIFEIFFYPWGLPMGYVDLCKMLEMKKNYFWSRSRFLQTWNLFTWDTVYIYSVCIFVDIINEYITMISRLFTYLNIVLFNFYLFGLIVFSLFLYFIN